MPQPSSIIAIAVGKWKYHRVPVSTPENEQKLGTDGEPQEMFTPPLRRASSEKKPVFQCNHDSWPCRIGTTDQTIIPSRIIAPPSLLASAVSEFATYLPHCLHAAFQLLGAHPFSRLDLLILPRCFASLGLASPSIIFLSQTLLSSDGSFLPRLAHEISHSWFGILIGARDWTEEWLSEGFATFMEDPIHAIAQKQWTTKEYQDWSNLRALLRYQTLKAEVENTESELQIMRPTADQTSSTSPREDLGGVNFVKNGLNPDKWFLQVHYLKGYFLLHHLASHLSMDKMLRFINLYVHRCHGQLVLSQDIFSLLFQEYPELKAQGITMETIYSDWLDKPGMPAGLFPKNFTRENELISAVKAEASRWKERDQIHQKAKGRKKRRKITAKETSELKFSSDQLILLLEDLLDAETMATRTLDELQVAYCLREQNAEVRHRWCELVVKHKHSAAYADIRHFLLGDQATGVYLYGELMASEDSEQQALARGCFQAVAMEMDRGCYRTVHEMLFGEPAEKPEGVR